ncbi:TonB-dependent receptor [Dysgonomonas sp. Marseille-P4677]|uniref:SusC/RagA family TonB-linked outer membrane protein n=1 Tax=Dysgonomonas sp. Marseille-P4677 TaxID=2364790 RepID=UPI0019134948|nr:TonB-dependent receptor [Dysgonomonas sp. Marseille-P4677]MBK5720855.1 TonB-dependent receptor [Dysgonomonas sp. Marseille-P4677]
MKIKSKKTFVKKASNLTLRRSLLVFTCLLLVSIANIYAQTKTITGMVTDVGGEPLIGVSVQVEGTSIGTVTDIDGKYSISVQNGNVIEFTYIGMQSQKIIVASQSVVNIVMQDNATMLTETVIIGYGTAKAKDLTSPIATIDGKEVNKHLTASPMQAMQGKVSGLQVINTGQPGSSPKVRIRGIGNYDNDKQGPLYVVDGMFFDNIDFLNNADIENISILKDASAAAIYGVRAANGVILVTTKKGVTNRRPQIVYDGYFAIQKASNLVKMANSEQYATVMKEIGNTTSIDQSIAKYGGSNGIPAVNTDWFDEILKPAPMHSHSISVNGGGEKTSYSVGISYLNQDGILDTDNSYERLNLRTKVDIGITDWLKVGGSFIVMNSDQRLANKSAFGNAYTSPSIYPVYNKNGKGGTLNPKNYVSPEEIGLGQYFWNPVALADYYNDKVGITQVLPAMYMELSFLESKLTFRTSFNQDLAFQRNRQFLPQYEISSNQQRAKSLLTKSTEYTNNWLIDNILTYRDSFNDSHNLTVMAGTSVRKDRWERLRLQGDGVPGERDEYWYLHNSDGIIAQDSDEDTWYDHAREYRGASFFGRAMYDYKGRYLLSATFRADGSSKYQEKWGYFPSVGLGWVLSEESFMKNQSIFDFLKIRGSWGLLGNDKIQGNDGFPSITQETGYFNGQLHTGTSSLSFFTFLKWEKVEEWDFGLDFTVLNNRLSGEFDYFKRTTKDAVFRKELQLGAGSLLMNNGEIQNSGIELSLNWEDRIAKDFTYNIGVNMSTLKNKVTKLDDLDRIITTGDYSRIRQVGQVVDAYYGYVMDGIYQNQAEIDNDPTLADIASKPVPGDIKFKDLDGDGKLTDQDRDVLGSPLPKLFLGGNIGFTYKNFDFGTAFQGQFGHKILNHKRFMRQKQSDINFDENIIKNRWTGEGSTNKYVSGAALGHTWTYSKFNTFFVENANTFTIQNIQFGYTFQNIFPKSNNRSSMRLSFTAERPFNFFSYNGFTTDVADGIDIDVYPLTSTYSIGVKITY